MIGSILNQRYRLDSELGHGGMGIVYRGYDLLLERDIAVKVLSDPTLTAIGRERLLREGRAVASLSHPNIVGVHDAGEYEDSYFIVMELADGRSLDEQRSQSIGSILTITKQICAALEHAHSHGIIHRDLKPENIKITSDGVVKLMDFGLARPLASRLTSEGTIVGTVFYLAPEQALGQEVDGRTDLYAMGVILYELTTGSLPFTGEDPLTIISQHLNAPLIPPRTLNPEIPPALDTLICRLMAKKPEDRPASAIEVRLILEELSQPNPALQEDGELHYVTRNKQATRLELFLLGPFQVLLNGVPVTQFESVKVRALLAYLAAESAHPHTRESLAGLLWPDWPQQSAMSNLRYALADLRKVISDRDAQPPFLFVTRESLQLNREADVQVDVIEFETGSSDQGSAIKDRQSGVINPQSTISRSEWFSRSQSAISLYRDPFLDGFSLPDSAPFEEWLLAKREYFSQQALKALSRLAEWNLEQGEYEQAEGYARRQIELEPWREQAYQQLMRTLSLKGERVQALAQFESLRKALQRELKVEPSEETLLLYGQIRNGKLEARKEVMAKVETAIPPPQEKPRHNLPTPITSFIGREKEIADVCNLLPEHRLVTLTGSGGVGKTRLAIEAARRMPPGYPDGVWLVELAPLADAALVTHTVARSLGMGPTSSEQALPLLLDYLENRHLLLVLDNCEHLVEACARLADRLLPACPQLFILATSREALGITGEAIFRLPPLSVPEAGGLPRPDALSQYEAIRLFIERAATTCTGFSLTPTNASAIAQVCQRLDGIPLAIEMAAARTRMLQVDEIASRLADRFQLLTSGSRTGLPRHQTLRLCLDWSYELLSPPERILLQRLSVFAVGWTLEAAEAVGCGEDLQACDVLELLGQLVDKSLVTAAAESGEATRYRMLETIRQYAQEKLAESGKAETVRDRHLQYYLALVEGVEDRLRKPGLELIQEQIDTELDNLRLAMEWSTQSESRPGWGSEPGLRLAAALLYFWHYQNRNAEGLAWLERLLTCEMDSRGEAPASSSRLKIRARALQVAGSLAMTMGERSKAIKMAEESRDLFQELGSDGKWDYAYSLYVLGEADLDLLDLSRGKTLAEECLRRSRATGDRFVEAKALSLLGTITRFQEDFEQAQAYFEASLAIQKEIGDQDGEAFTLFAFGEIAMSLWDFEKARFWLEEGLSLYTAIRHIWGMNTLRDQIGLLDWVEGKYEQAASKFEQSLSSWRRRGYHSRILGDLANLGQLALHQGDSKRAAELLTENLAISRKWDNKLYIASALYSLGKLDLAQGEAQQAARRFAEAQALHRELGQLYAEGFAVYCLGKAEHALGNQNAAREHLREALHKLSYTDLMTNKATALEALAFLADDEQQLERAVRLLSASQAWHSKCQRIRSPGERQEREAHVSALRTALGEEAFAAAWTEGEAMTQEQVVEYAKQV